MTIWKPAPVIRVKVLGLAWRGDELLLGEVEDSSGRVTGMRPLGGCIEFGETREEAIRREFREELGCDITLEGPWHALESLFEHEGAVGHEYVFAASITLKDPEIYSKDSFRILEPDGMAWHVRWQTPDRLPEAVNLYPRGLGRLLDEGAFAG